MRVSAESVLPDCIVGVAGLALESPKRGKVFKVLVQKQQLTFRATADKLTPQEFLAGFKQSHHPITVLPELQGCIG